MEKVLGKLKELSGCKYIQLTEKGNKSVMIALTLANDLGKEKVLIQDQGGWITYKQYPNELGMEIVEIKTNYGLIDIDDLSRILKLKRSYIYLLTHERKIPHYKLQGHLRFRLSNIEEWLKKQFVNTRYPMKVIDF